MEAAVVSATLGAAGILLQKLGNMVVADNWTPLGGVWHEIQELKDDLVTLTACLRDLDSAGDDTRSELTTAWMNQVREIGYDSDDCIDIFTHQLEIKTKYPGQNEDGCLVKHIHKLVNLLRTQGVRKELAATIQSLRSRAQRVSERRLMYKLDATEANLRPLSMLGSTYADMDRRLPALHGDDSRLVGMAPNKANLIKILNGGDNHLRVISIVGYGGLGKTTLALSVYNSSDMPGIKSRAFVPVSQTYDPKSLLKSILRGILPKSMSNEEEDLFKDIEKRELLELIEMSKEYLENKRYLVILDDVWSSTAWEDLRRAFPDDGNGSRIVVTTRIDEVAQSCSSSDDIYRMKTLEEKYSKKLLFKTVFGTEQWPSSTNYEDYEDACKDIMKKCGGLPLAIVSIGGMLAQRRNEPVAKWQALFSRLPNELETNSTLEGMGRILSLSYNDLPYHLKACFLYLSVFPEDHEIRRGPLVRRWTGESFISARHGLSIDEIAQSYFDVFASRSIVIPEQLASNGEVRSFKVHDIMLDVITSKSVRENFISFLGNPRHNTEDYGQIRRLSIQPGSINKGFSPSLYRVRSLTIMRNTERPKAIITFKNLTLLRVLDLEGCKWLSDQDLMDICKLSLLRYLSLRGTTISKIPAMIGKLKGLLILDVRQTSVRDLPRSITWLQNLNHLLAGGYRYYTRSHSVKHFDYETAVKIPPGFSNMRALQRISFINIEKNLHALHEVEKLTQLTRLCVMQMNHHATWEPFGDSLSKLSTSLRYLSIMQYTWESSKQLDFLHHLKSPPLYLQSMHLMGRLKKLPEWISSLSNLGSLSLRETYLKKKMIKDVLGKLPSLVSLKLYRLSYTGSELLFEKGQFLSLKQLVADEIKALDKIIFQQGGAPGLERLSLALGSSKRQILGIGNLKQLRKVELYGDISDEGVEAVTTLVSKEHPTNPPKVTREDRFTET
ncbi:unnamed protein product [Urochloa humidicola]